MTETPCSFLSQGLRRSLTAQHASQVEVRGIRVSSTADPALRLPLVTPMKQRSSSMQSDLLPFPTGPPLLPHLTAISSNLWPNLSVALRCARAPPNPICKLLFTVHRMATPLAIANEAMKPPAPDDALKTAARQVLRWLQLRKSSPQDVSLPKRSTSLGTSLSGRAISVATLPMGLGRPVQAMPVGSRGKRGFRACYMQTPRLAANSRYGANASATSSCVRP